MAEERESQKSHQGTGQPDVEGHGHVPRTDDSEPDELKTKLANDEDDVEGHIIFPKETP